MTNTNRFTRTSKINNAIDILLDALDIPPTAQNQTIMLNAVYEALLNHKSEESSMMAIAANQEARRLILLDL